MEELNLHTILVKVLLGLCELRLGGGRLCQFHLGKNVSWFSGKSVSDRKGLFG